MPPLDVEHPREPVPAFEVLPPPPTLDAIVQLNSLPTAVTKPLNGHITPMRDNAPSSFRTIAFAASALDGTGLHAGDVTAAEVHGPILPGLVSSYVVSKSEENLRSIALAARVGPRGEGSREQKTPLTELSLGVGTHRFTWQGHDLWAVQQAIGQPVGTGVGAAQYENLILVAKGRGSVELLRSFCGSLIAASERGSPGTYTLFRWDVQSQCWCMQGSRTARNVSSVVLPQEKKDRLLSDVAEFLSPATRLFYLSHGIPYRRAYLFHGIPGTGKTSLIQALAGEHGRNICVMQPTDPSFTDDMLKAAVCNAPARSIIVLEDIDALFTRCRQSRGKSAVTFAGLLNALDGVGMPEGQMFMLTTNFRDQLDDALVRNGRVDYHLQFDYATAEVCSEMFGQFYPATRDGPQPGAFATALQRDLGEFAGRLTPAMLQHFFVLRRKLSADETLRQVSDIADDLRERELAISPRPASKPAEQHPKHNPDLVPTADVVAQPPAALQPNMVDSSDTATPPEEEAVGARREMGSRLTNFGACSVVFGAALAAAVKYYL